MPSRERSLVLAMVVTAPARAGLEAGVRPRARPVDPGGGARVGGATEDELYRRWTGSKRARSGIEASRRRHLRVGEVLRSMTSRPRISRAGPALWPRSATRATAGGGRCRSSTGFFTDRAGRPVCVEVFDGATHDHDRARPARQAQGPLRPLWLVLVADRGMVDARQPRRDPASPTGSTGSPR